MMKITQKICIDLAQKRPLPRLDAVQNEAQTREIEVSLFENGAAWDIPAGTTAAVAFRKPDGTCGLYDRLPDGSAALAFSGHRVTATLAYQVLTCAGSVRVSVILYDEALNQLATFPFVLEVEENPAAGEVISNNYYNYSTLADINAAIYGASSSISRLDKRVTNLEKGILPDPFLTDDSVAYTKTVPENALPFAEITEIGGMTYKDGDTLRSAPVTAVESVGANLISFPYVSSDKTTNNGVTFSVNTDGSVALNGTASGTAYFCLGGGYYSGKNPIPKWLNEGETYTISGGVPTVAVELYLYDSTGKATTFTSKHVENAFQVPSEKSYYGIFIRVDTGVTVSETIYPMLNRGSTAKPYTPYVKRTLEIPEAAQAKNGINENIYDYTDLTEDKKYVRVGMKDAGTLKWTVWDSNGDGVANRAYSDRFAKPNGSVIASALPVGSRDVYIDAYGAVCAHITDGGYTSETFKAAMSGVMLCYELAEPIITDISDILPADNFIQVEEGGTVTMVNDYEYDVPSKITYQIKEEG